MESAWRAPVVLRPHHLLEAFLVKTLPLVLLVGLLSSPLAMSAEKTSKRVSLAGLDFSQRADVVTAHIRIKRAAAEVCGYIRDRRTLHRDKDRQRCYDDALNAALEQINNPKLLDLASN